MLALGASSVAQAACVAPVAINVSSLTPAGGAAAGGYAVNINGSNLNNTTSVQFGGVNAPITSNTGTRIIVTAPAKPGGGAVNVVLFGAYGENTSGATCVPITSYTSPIDFTYVVTAIVVSSSPALISQVGVAYTQTNTAAGGNGNFTFSVASGALPAGTSLDSGTGTVSGTPTTTGPFSYTIRATDSPVSTPATGATVSGTVSPAALAVSATPSATTQVGQPYSQTNVASGGTAPYTYSVDVGTLPAGTTLNTSTGTVSGTPTTAGFFSYSIKATDNTSATASSLSTTGTITNAGVTLTSTPSATTQVAQPYSQTNVASAGSGLYTYSLNSGTLPAGTTLNVNTGLVSGTPTTAGAFSYSILVTDSVGGTASNTISGTIAAQGFTLTSTPSAVTRVGQPYSQTNVASFGTPGYTYAVTAGAVPAGTTLNTSSGTVSGTPTTAGAFSYQITATDNAAQTRSQTISGTISPSFLTIASTPSAQTKLGQPYSQANTASGGTPAYTYTLYAGALPTGTTLNASTGVVSGTPSVPGLFFYSILVTDSGAPAQTATSTTVSGVIAAASSTVTLTSSVNPSTFGQAVTFTAT